MKKLLLSLALCSVVSAQATTFEIGMLPTAPAVYTHSTYTPGNLSFQNVYNFTTDSSLVSASAVSVNVRDVLNIDKLQLSLYTASGQFLGSGTLGNSSALFNFTVEPNKSYSYVLDGIGNGKDPGFYSFIASAAPVPEIPVSLMMMLGLVALARKFV
jgi:hypothetical protein